MFRFGALGLPRRFRYQRAVALAGAAAATLALSLAPPALAQSPAGAMQQPAQPVPPGEVVIGRQRPAVGGTLANGASVTYTVNYQPLPEDSARLAPWLVRLNLNTVNGTPNSVAFTWIDQTPPVMGASTSGNTGKSVGPQTGSNTTDVPPGVDPTLVQQAVLSAAQPGNFSITINNSSGGPVSYVFQVIPLLFSNVEPGANPNRQP